MELIHKINNQILWGLPMVALMLGTGIYLTILTGGTIFRKFGIVLRYTLGSLLRRRSSGAQAGAITPFQAVCTALAATVGTGNIVGVALAIAIGGPGSIFWLWMSALAGMVIKYCEVTLSVAYRTTNHRGELVGGPMYYISAGLGKKWLAALFAVFGFVASFGIGASVQGNSLATGIHAAFGLPTWAIGLIAATLGALVIIGGIRRIAGVTEILVPFMALFYLLGAIAVLLRNAATIPEALRSIFFSAFTGTAATGGFLGASVLYACRIGIARGVFTHEAGMGSAPIAHASADTDHPARQGLWGAFEVFFDSIVMCTITALVILTSGLWKANPQPNEGAMSSAAFGQALPGGQYIVTIGLALFAFATIIAWYYYGEKCLEFLIKDRRGLLRLYQMGYVAFIYIGCVSSLDAVWEFADLCNGLMAVPNLLALICLGPVLRRLTQDLFRDPHRLRPTNGDFHQIRKK